MMRKINTVQFFHPNLIHFEAEFPIELTRGHREITYETWARN